jgi:hypothetical protein
MRRVSVLVCVFALLAAACGGGEDNSGADEGESAATTSLEGGEPDDAGTSVTTTAPANAADTSVDDSDGDVATAGAGSANLAIGDMTYEFDGLTCYYDDNAAEAAEDEDVTFAAVAQDGDSAIVVQLSDKGLMLFEVLYVVGDGTVWAGTIAQSGQNLVGGEYSIEDGQITVSEVELEHVVDSEVTETAGGSVSASCG